MSIAGTAPVYRLRDPSYKSTFCPRLYVLNVFTPRAFASASTSVCAGPCPLPACLDDLAFALWELLIQGSPADAVVGFKDEDGSPRRAYGARGREPRDPCADNDHVDAALPGAERAFARCPVGERTRGCGHSDGSGGSEDIQVS